MGPSVLCSAFYVVAIMYLMMVLGMFVFVILCISLCRWTVSKALFMSSATAMVLCGGWFMLKPFVMMLFMLCSAVVVQCLCAEIRVGVVVMLC